MQIDREKLANLYREANGWSPGAYPITMEELEKFAKLVAEHEREACAQVCEAQGAGRKAMEHYAALTYSGAAHDCAAAIRARGNT